MLDNVCEGGKRDIYVLGPRRDSPNYYLGSVESAHGCQPAASRSVSASPRLIRDAFFADGRLPAVRSIETTSARVNTPISIYPTARGVLEAMFIFLADYHHYHHA